jgi:hypothetical protein
MPYHLAADRELALQELDTMRDLTSHPPRRRTQPGYCGVWLGK